MNTKAEYKDSLLFYRLGDFYEMFYDDAITVSRELELVLTGKSCGLEEKAPMCGVPYHAADNYITKLVDKGYKVAICEQVEDPKESKGLVRREVVRVVTPGTNIDSKSDSALFVSCIIRIDEDYGISFADIGTGEFIIKQTSDISKIKELLLKNKPKEILLNNNCYIKKDIFLSVLDNNPLIYQFKDIISTKKEANAYLLEHFKDDTFFNEEHYALGIISGANLLKYLIDTQKNNLSHINHIKFLSDDNLLKIDSFTFKNLELLEPIRRDDNKGSLFYCLDKTGTAMGKRLLKNFIRYPSTDIEVINNRLDAIEELCRDMLTAESLRQMVKVIYDLERIICRVSFKNANPRDLLSLKISIGDLPRIKELLSNTKAMELREISGIDTLNDIFTLIDNSISEEAPVSVHDSFILKSGYSSDCDDLRLAARDGKSLLTQLEEKEREKTGISKLKIKYNRVFGYYFEVTNSQLDLVPEYFIRRQTLANCERYFTQELKKLEDTILGAKEKLDRLEYDMYMEILNSIYNNIPRIQNTANLIARLDVYLSMAEISLKNRYVRPDINTEGIIDIHGGRHPVVETMQRGEMFISNDTYLNNDRDMIYLITGPNMAGKSTYMRQCAIICLMAQIGCFIPADYGNIGIVDRIFTRVGASDDLSSGQSTFMVEMYEMANILKNATENSLIILDEIGRGTSTYDGLSIAWSVIEHISKTLKAKTLFATHYHELTALEQELSNVKNYSCGVKEEGDNIIFLRKIIDGAADKSYGIQVAGLAGVPEIITDRAKEILMEITAEKHMAESTIYTKSENVLDTNQLSFFETKENRLIKRLREFDINNATPMLALNFLHDLKQEL